MIDLFETARELQSFCDRQGGRTCFIGGIAVQRWGEPRVTRDVEVAVVETARSRSWRRYAAP